MKLSTTTNLFIEDMDLYKNKEILELEDIVIKKDIKVRKKIRNAWAVSAFLLGFFIIFNLESWNFQMQKLFEIMMIIGLVLLLGYLIVIGIDKNSLRKENKKFEKEKLMYIEKVNDKYFRNGIYVKNIIDDLSKYEIYNELEIRLLLHKIRNKKISEKDILDLCLKLRTSKLKEFVLPSTTESIESQREII